jgi:serine/threonine-protein kinase
MDENLNRERWQRIEKILDTAFDLPPFERAAWVEEACAGDADLRARVLALLRADERASGVLDESADALARDLLGEVADAPSEPEPAGAPLTEIPPWRIVREIGEGGMGRVYLAERADGQFEQRVALKVVRPGRSSEAIRARFLQERQILAGLQHPNIAALVDGGVTGEGQPYFAMEFVEGLPITDYAREQRLSTAGRLDLFRDVCAAVAYAQQRLVVHRDLKPSNILVTVSGQVKLLDFGIAKLLGTAEDEALTQAGGRLLTPEYAAPEQVRGEAVTTASDVYALGGVLYELLTGARPRRAATGGQGRAPVTGSGAPARGIKGDLANIVGMAMADEPERRYATAGALGDDLRRFREGLPVVARAPSMAYRARKFVARNALAVGAALAVLLTLVGGLIATRLQAERAEQQARRAATATQFLAGLFQASDPDLAQGEDPPASEILARGLARIEQELGDDPQLQAEMFATIGRIQEKRGAYAQAETLFTRALELHRGLRGAPRAFETQGLLDLGSALYWQSRYAEADSVFMLALELERRSRDPDERQIANALSNRASAMNNLGLYEEADPLYRESIAMDRRLHGENSLPVATDLGNYANYLGERGRHAEAESLLHEVLAIRRTHLPAIHSDIAGVLHNLGFRMTQSGKLDSAEVTIRAAIDMRNALYGGPHARTASTIRMLGNLAQSRGRLDEADSLYLEALETSRAALGDVHLDVANCINDRAVVAFLRGDLESSRRRFSEALAVFEQLLPADHPNVITIKSSLGRLALETGDLDDAERVYRELLAQRLAVFGSIHPRTGDAWIGMGVIHGQRERWKLASAAMDSAVRAYTGSYDERHLDVANANSYRAWTLGELQRYDEARALLEASLARFAEELPETHPRRVDARLRLGRILTLQGNAAAALPHLEFAHAARAKAYGAADARTAEAQALRGAALEGAGRRAEARSALDSAVTTLRARRGPGDLEARRAMAVRARL